MMTFTLSSGTGASIRRAKEAARLAGIDWCNRRAFDDCFEMGDGADVAVELGRMAADDPEIMAAVSRNVGYMPNLTLQAAGLM